MAVKKHSTPVDWRAFIAAHFGIPPEEISDALFKQVTTRRGIPYRPDRFCGGCSHFHQSKSWLGGECRISAPRLNRADWMARWPSVMARDWCSKFKPEGDAEVDDAD